MIENFTARSMRDAFLIQIYNAMREDASIFFVTADFGSPVLDFIRAEYPQRYLNVGIAEQNLINVSAGLALEGCKVFAYAIAPFITMRCYEQIKINLSLMSGLRPMVVNLIGVGAGFSYTVSGPSHHAIEDISLMRVLPGVEVVSPSDRVSAASSFALALQPGIRYYRFDSQNIPDLHSEPFTWPETGFALRRSAESPDAVLVSTGYMTTWAAELLELLAGRNLRIRHIDLLQLKNPDMEALRSQLAGVRNVFSLEEGFINKGGVDSLIRSLLEPGQYFKGFGLGDEYRFAIGSRKELLANYGLIPEKIAGSILEVCNHVGL